MHFEKRGSSGPAVVLIHGLGAYSFSWRETAAALSEHYVTYAVDLLGFGQSTAPAGFAYTAKAQAEAVAAFMNTQALSDPIIIGHSMGGAVCLYLAAQAGRGSVPGLSKMVLIAPVTSPPSSPSAVGNAGALSAAMELPGFAAILAKQVLEQAYADASLITSAQIDGYAKGLSSRDQLQAFFKHSSNLGQISFSPSELSRIKIKTRIIWGEDDKFLPIKNGDDLERALLPNASPLQRIKNCGHIPQEERPAETNDLIEKFLK
jgi:pimeloyl-ACP methyl ester carboxylesterase